jgi:membrane protein YqaA with SNARE-associated domain
MLKILTVAGLATFEIYAAIPAGFVMGLNPWTIFFASMVGGLAGVFISVFLGEKIKTFFSKYRKTKENKEKKTPGFIRKIWDKFGVIGLGLIGTFTIGAPISIGIGVGFNVPLKKMMLWCCLGVLARCAIFTVLGHFGKQALF